MFHYKITLRYDGTAYSGWQLQPDHPTIQGEIEKALKKITRRFVRVAGASRTDAGVHALAQVVLFALEKKWDPFRLQGGLNAVLPDDIAVTRIIPLKGRIDPTKAASKVYHYRVWNHMVRDPLLKNRAWWVRHPLNRARIRAALKVLVGRHDFSSFAASDRTTKTSIRVVQSASLQSRGDLLTLSFQANGFLKGMVRNLVGTLVDIGRGRIPAGEMKKIMKRRDRRAAGPTAPASGLYLMWIRY